MSQIYLFIGENRYELGKERSRWIQEFTEKHGPENLLVVEGKDAQFSLLINEVSTAPFIAEKRLVVIDGLPKIDKDQLKALASSIHPQTLLLIIEPSPDKRLSVTKELMAIATVKTFTPLRGSALIAWLAPSLGQREATKLIAMVGEDQLLLANEVQKLTTYAGDRPVTCEDIENLVMLSTEKAVWQLMDLLGAKKREEALQFTETILKRGENPHGLWSMFLWMVAQFSQVAAQVIEGNTNPQSIAKACGMHPNTARNLISLAQSYDHKRLLHLITLVIDSDIKLKTGGFKATDQSPEELNAILDTRIAAVI